jgi:thiol:disulfide interchange protein DsbC
MLASQYEVGKMKFYLVILFVCCGLAFAHKGYAQEVKIVSEIDENIAKVLGDREFEINDYNDFFKEVVVGSDLYLATHDGRYIFAGPVFDTVSMQDIYALGKNKQRKLHLSSQPQNLFIHYPSTNEKYVVTVFTDIDCPYCRKMHQDMEAFNHKGISVNYVMVPRGGVGSAAYNKTLSALCSAKPAESITQAMANIPISLNDCLHKGLLTKQLKLAQSLKITSTPSIVLPNGELKLGLTSPVQMMSFLAPANK